MQSILNIVYKLSLIKSYILLLIFLCIRDSYRIPSSDSLLYLHRLRNLVHMFSIPTTIINTNNNPDNYPNNNNQNPYHFNKKITKSSYTVRRNNEILTSRTYKHMDDRSSNNTIENRINVDDHNHHIRNIDLTDDDSNNINNNGINKMSSQVFSPYRSKRQRIRYGKALLITSRMNNYNHTTSSTSTEVSEKYNYSKYKSNSFIQQKHHNHNYSIEGNSHHEIYNNIEDRRNQQGRTTTNIAAIGTMAIKNIVSECSDFNTKPSYNHLNLDFDYLSTNTLHTIQLLPNHRKSKGEFYLRKWWSAAKKWNLLTGELKEFADNLKVNQQKEEQQQKLINNSISIINSETSQYKDSNYNNDINTSNNNINSNIINDSNSVDTNTFISKYSNNNNNRSIIIDKSKYNTSQVLDLNNNEVLANNLATLLPQKQATMWAGKISNMLRQHIETRNNSNNATTTTPKLVLLGVKGSNKNPIYLGTLGTTENNSSVSNNNMNISNMMMSRKDFNRARNYKVANVAKGFASKPVNLKVISSNNSNSDNIDNNDDSNYNATRALVSSIKEEESVDNISDTIVVDVNNNNTIVHGNKYTTSSNEVIASNYNNNNQHILKNTTTTTTTTNSSTLYDSSAQSNAYTTSTTTSTTMITEQDNIPIRLLTQICKQNKARVIVIGDVHGCIEEFGDLLRKVEYRPGDLVLLLGDLVAKGPASVEVVRMAMDIGAISVRGNHDQEVLRQGLNYIREIVNSDYNTRITSNSSSYIDSDRFKVDLDTIPEHLNIALQLSPTELEWLSELPFYIRSADLGTLFVHAGFQQGIKLQHQEPWVMMTMRSLLPTGKASPRCVLNYPWALQWNGPMTVYFGHDTARGIQIYKSAIGIDTGCVYGGNLTAVLLPSNDIVSVPARKVYQQYGKSVTQQTNGSFSTSTSNVIPLSPSSLAASSFTSYANIANNIID